MRERCIRTYPDILVGVGVQEAVRNPGPALRQESPLLAVGIPHVVPPVRDLNDTFQIEEMVDQRFVIPIVCKDDCDINGACKSEMKTVKRQGDIHTRLPLSLRRA